MQRDLRQDAALAHALEYTGTRIAEVIADARERRCLFYKANDDLNTGMIILSFADAGTQSFRRILNCLPFFDGEGLYFDIAARSQIICEADSLVFASGEFQEYRMAKIVRAAARREAKGANTPPSA